jgi:hypothetical protein
MAARLKSTGYLHATEVFNTDDLTLILGQGGAIPDLMASMGYPHSVEDTGRVRAAFSEYLIRNKATADWTSTMGRVYFTNDDDAVMARCLG